MKTRQLIKKTIVWIGIAMILISGIACSGPSKVDISEKLNTERLEDAAAVVLTSASDPQFVSEDVVSPAGQEDSADETKSAAAEAIVPDSPLYDKLGAPKHYSVELTPTSDVVKITVDADVYLPDTDRMPTLHVTPGDFTQEEVTRLFRALCGVLKETVEITVRCGIGREEQPVEFDIQGGILFMIRDLIGDRRIHIRRIGTEPFFPEQAV